MVVQTLWSIVFVIEGVGIVFLNILAAIIFSKKVHRSKSCFMLINQSIADLLVGIKVIWNFIYVLVTPSPTSDDSEANFCGYPAVGMMIWGFVIEGSMVSLALIALERAYAVLKPFQHRALSSKHYRLAIFTTWSLIAVQFFSLAILRCQLKDKMPEGLVIGIIVTAVLIDLLIIIVSYVSIYLKLRFYPIFQNNSQTQAQVRLSRTLFYATTASLLTVVPASIVESFSVAANRRNTLSVNLTNATLFIVFANSFINIVIYAWRFPGFAKDLKKLLCCHRTGVEIQPSVELEVNIQT